MQNVSLFMRDLFNESCVDDGNELAGGAGFVYQGRTAERARSGCWAMTAAGNLIRLIVHRGGDEARAMQQHDGRVQALHDRTRSRMWIYLDRSYVEIMYANGRKLSVAWPIYAGHCEDRRHRSTIFHGKK